MESKWEFNNRYEVTFEVESGFVFKREFIFPDSVSEEVVIKMLKKNISELKDIRKIIQKKSCIRIF